VSDQPNILFIMADDHASHAMSCYGSRINRTPNLDRIADEGMRFDNCFCTNGICTPSRAAILTGTYNHINKVTTLSTHMDNRLLTYPKLLQEAGYQTALFGKWHLGSGPEHEPSGFDDWRVLPGQGLYHSPVMIDSAGQRVHVGYVTDLITDMSLQWLKDRDKSKPFCMMVHHKAPHREWQPDAKHATMYEDEEILEPETFNDTYANRSSAAAAAKMRMEDLQWKDLKADVPGGLTPEQEKSWRYQRYIKDYLRVIASVDDGVGKLLDHLEAEGIVDNTLVIYTSDQGFFLGDHGWFDKRFMYEESLRMPFVLRFPSEVKAGSSCEDMILNVDFASLFLDVAGVTIPDEFQGRSFRPILHGERPSDWRTSMYYRYWMHGDGAHNVYAHYGLRTHDHKLIFFYNDGCGQAGSGDQTHPPEWELFDLKEDPYEICSIYGEDASAATQSLLTDELHRLQADVGDERYHLDT